MDDAVTFQVEHTDVDVRLFRRARRFPFSSFLRGGVAFGREVTVSFVGMKRSDGGSHSRRLVSPLPYAYIICSSSS